MIPTWLLDLRVLLGIGVVALGIAWKVQTVRLDALRTEYAEFKAGVEALGKAAEKAAKEKEAKDKANKEKADAENKRTTATHLATVAKLRAQRPSGGFVPPAPASSSRPDLACFDRAEYQRTDGIFTAGARYLSDEGTKNTVDLDTAKGWAQRQ